MGRVVFFLRLIGIELKSEREREREVGGKIKDSVVHSFVMYVFVADCV